MLGFLNGHMLGSVYAVCGQGRLFQRQLHPFCPGGLPSGLCLVALFHSKGHKSSGAVPVLHPEAQVSYSLWVICLRSQFPPMSSRNVHGEVSADSCPLEVASAQKTICSFSRFRKRV